MQKSFYTIKENATNELVEKKSRFIANLFYVQSEEEANQKIEEVKRANRDARHNVFAYRLENGLEKYSDDGEPSGTAGVPILDILRGEKLVNVLIVVTRYFGGILLRNWWIGKSICRGSKISFRKCHSIRNEVV